jgi:DNA adenine methylase
MTQVISKKRNTPAPVNGKPAGRKLIAFGWYGGKYSHLDWLLPLLPKCHHYCEPFGGSAAVLLNREPSPIETYNDIDGEVCNFFRVLREDKERLIEQIGLTPFSREEFAVACQIDPVVPPMERARRFYVREYKPSWYEWRCEPMVRWSRYARSNCCTVYPRADRKSSSYRCHSAL